MYTTIRIAACTVFLLVLVNVATAQHRIQWARTWPEATSAAQRSQRLILLHFWNYNCPPCLLLERRVFNQPEVIRAVHSQYVPLKVNVAENEDMAEHFKIDKWPTDVIVTPEGKEVFRAISQQDPHRFVATLHQVAAHVSMGLPIHGYAATPAPPEQGEGRDTNAFPAPGSEPGSPPPASSKPAAPQPNTAGTGPAMIENQFAGSLKQTSPPRQADMAPAYGGQFRIPQASGQPQPPAEPPPVDRPTSQHQTPAHPYGITQVGIPRQAGLPAVGEEAGGHGPPALDGYCAVTLVQEEKWVKGDERWGVVHRGRLYLFASQQNAEAFYGNPSTYAPALSGYDPVTFLEQGTLVDGHRAHGIFYHKQVILFASEQTLEKFWQSPERYDDALRVGGQ